MTCIKVSQYHLTLRCQGNVYGSRGHKHTLTFKPTSICLKDHRSGLRPFKKRLVRRVRESCSYVLWLITIITLLGAPLAVCPTCPDRNGDGVHRSHRTIHRCREGMQIVVSHLYPRCTVAAGFTSRSRNRKTLNRSPRGGKVSLTSSNLIFYSNHRSAGQTIGVSIMEVRTPRGT